MQVSNNEFKLEIFDKTNHMIFNIMHSIQDKDIIDSILTSITANIASILERIMDAGKINLQLLVSCLSLVVLKEIKQSPNREEIMKEIGNITDNEK